MSKAHNRRSQGGPDGPHAFSLIETMVASAVLSVIGVSLLASMSFSSSEIAATRVRAVAAADAQAQLDRMLIMSGVTTDDTKRCALYTAAGGPMDATVGTVSGTCPTTTGSVMTVSNIRIGTTAVTRTVTLTAISFGDAKGWQIGIEVNGPQLTHPITVTSQIKR